MVQREMPRYKCHKEVWALKLSEVVVPSEPDGNVTLVFEDLGYAPIRIDRAEYDKHQPESGWYWVHYEDGYKSFSPPKAFESGYTRIGE